MKNFKKLSTQEIFNFIYNETELSPLVTINAEDICNTDLEDKAEIFKPDYAEYLVFIESGDAIYHKFFDRLDESKKYATDKLYELIPSDQK